jgi:hypothetical protein
MRQRGLRPQGRSAGFAPRLEVLEGRCLPAVSATQIGALLLITGTNGADDIRIGDAGTGQISVLAGLPTLQPTFPQIFNGVRTIRVRTLGGNDSVHYDLLGNATTSLALGVDLGAGADRFVAFMNGNDLGAGAVYRLAVSGGAGNDRLGFASGNDPDRTTVARLSQGLVLPFAQGTPNNVGSPGVDIAVGAALGLAFNGGGGNDVIGIADEGTIAGSPFPTGTPFTTGPNTSAGLLSVLTAGGIGNDVVATRIIADANSGGRIVGRALGGAGDDNLTLIVQERVSPVGATPTFPLVNGRIDGGPGVNHSRRTSNVTVVRCQTDVVVPGFLPPVIPLTGLVVPA